LDEDSERIANEEEPTTGSVNEVEDMPPQFKAWVKDNQGRIAKLKKGGLCRIF
jgi:hypothetical protein